MKTMLHALICILLISLFSCASFTKAQQVERQLKVQQAVEAKNFRIAVSYANPVKMTPRALSGGYDFAVRADSAFAFLPYFGEAYSATAYGNTEGGIKFAEPLRDYKITGNAQNGYEISFEIKSPRDTYKVFITVGATGYASINVTPLLSSFISYSGELALPEKPPQK